MATGEACTPRHLCQHFQRAAELIGKRWNPQIVRALQSGETRFTDLRNGIPSISDAVLSERLKELETLGIVTRTVTPDDPRAASTTASPNAAGTSKVMEELAAWAERWAERRRTADSAPV